MANSFVNKKADLTTTSVTTLYTVPSATTGVIKSILVSEDSGNADTITVTITDTSDNVFSLFKTKSISANATAELLTAPLILEESEVLNHEMRHATDMKIGKLKYEDDYVKYNGISYERKEIGGKDMIRYEGEWIQAGSTEFPWEFDANNGNK